MQLLFKYNYYELRRVRERVLRPLPRPLHLLRGVPGLPHHQGGPDVPGGHRARPPAQGRRLPLQDLNPDEGAVRDQEEEHRGGQAQSHQGQDQVPRLHHPQPQDRPLPRPPRRARGESPQREVAHDHLPEGGGAGQEAGDIRLHRLRPPPQDRGLQAHLRGQDEAAAQAHRPQLLQLEDRSLRLQRQSQLQGGLGERGVGAALPQQEGQEGDKREPEHKAGRERDAEGGLFARLHPDRALRPRDQEEERLILYQPPNPTTTTQYPSAKFHPIQSITIFENITIMQHEQSLSATKSLGKEGEEGQEGGQGTKPLLFQKFMKYLSKSRHQKLVNGICNYYGKNFAIAYKDKFNFQQRWQQRKAEASLDDYLLDDINLPYSTFSLLVLLLNFLSIWVLSTERYFQTHLLSHQLSLYLVLSAVKASEVVFRSLVKSKREGWGRISMRTFLDVNCKELCCLLFFLYMEVREGEGNAVQTLCEIYIYYLLWKSASNIYQNIKLKSFALKYENQLKIFDLLLNIFIQAHVFSILMFCASKINPNDNWTTAIGVSNSFIYEQYLYAFYFSCTTMLTIGYGDITPTHAGEVGVVILIQITGVVSFGYLLNEMGHTLSKMRQQKEALEKDLQTIGKMCKYYGLDKGLQNRAKKYIITNHKIIEELRPDEEDRLLMKFNDELRTQITNENSLSIVKSSIFYLCHWSKGFQGEIAKALQKRLFSPNQRLAQFQRIYIIKAGKVSIYMNRFNNGNKKLLRTISVSGECEVGDNIYGYSSAFSNRRVHLQGVTREITTTYSIGKEHFVRCVGLDKQDFEYYHQIKCKIDQSPFCEEWEAPAINSIRQHYIPSKIFLIKKNRAKVARQADNRAMVLRRQRKKYRLINNLHVLNAKSIDDFTNEYTIGEKTLQFIARKKQEICEARESQGQNLSESSVESISEPQKFNKGDTNEVCLQLARVYMRTRGNTTAAEESDNKRVIADNFERRRDYSKFFPRNNFPHVLARLQRENFLEHSWQYK